MYAKTVLTFSFDRKESSKEQILKANQNSDLQEWSYMERHHEMQCRS